MRSDIYYLINNGQRQIPVKVIIDYRYLDVPENEASVSIYGTKIGSDPVVVMNNFVLRNTSKTYCGYAWSSTEIGLLVDKDVTGIWFEMLSNNIEIGRIALVYNQGSITGGLAVDSTGLVPSTTAGHSLSIVVEPKDKYIVGELFNYTVSRDSKPAISADLFINSVKVGTLLFANDEQVKNLSYTPIDVGQLELRSTSNNHVDGLSVIQIEIVPVVLSNIFIQYDTPTMNIGDYWFDTSLAEA